MLIDAILPRYQKSEYHEVVATASPDELWAALESTDLSRPLLIRLLMGLRAVPRLVKGAGSFREKLHLRRVPLRLRDMEKFGFQPMEEGPHEIVFGIEGRFWLPVAEVRPGDRERFAQPLSAGTARAAWNFKVEPVDATHSRLLTITRIECADAATLRSFGRYWLVVRPFSGLIRILMLQVVMREVAPRG